MNEMTKIVAAKPLTGQEKMAIAKQLHEQHWPTVAHAGQELGIKPATLFTWLARYRNLHNLPASTRGRAMKETATLTEKQRAKRVYNQRYLAKQRALAAGEIVAVAAPALPESRQLVTTDSEVVKQLRARIKELEAELLHREHELQVMQKLVFVVGERLL